MQEKKKKKRERKKKGGVRGLVGAISPCFGRGALPTTPDRSAPTGSALGARSCAFGLSPEVTFFSGVLYSFFYANKCPFPLIKPKAQLIGKLKNEIGTGESRGCGVLSVHAFLERNPNPCFLYQELESVTRNPGFRLFHNTLHLRLPDGRPIIFWVLVLVGACQSGTVWAGLCLTHHHHFGFSILFWGLSRKNHTRPRAGGANSAPKEVTAALRTRNRTQVHIRNPGGSYAP